MDKKLSFILPIYKVEAYLPQCVDSILSQATEDCEIILVDDGSPDGCGAICDRYAESYEIVKVIHKPNGGLSDARNAGFDQAQGKYVLFVDSDDYLEPLMLLRSRRTHRRTSRTASRVSYLPRGPIALVGCAGSAGPTAVPVLLAHIVHRVGGNCDGRRRGPVCRV